MDNTKKESVDILVPSCKIATHFQVSLVSIFLVSTLLYSPLSFPIHHTVILTQIRKMATTSEVMLLLGLLILWKQIYGQLSPCEAGLLEVARQIFNVTSSEPAARMAQYSGKSIDDLGDYFACGDLEGAEYALIQIAAGMAQIGIGICGPQSCTIEEYYAMLEGAMQPGSKLAAGHPLLANQVKALQYLSSKYELGVSQERIPIMVSFPQRYIHQHFTNLSAGAIVMVVFCSFLAFIVLLGTVLDYQAKHSQRQAKKGLLDEDGTELSPSSPAPTIRPPSFLEQLLICFSVYTNFPKLFASRSAEKTGQADPMELLNGVRVMSMGWVILGHCYLYRLTYSCIRNFNDILPLLEKAKTTVVYSGQFAVDSFFWMSGFLMAVLLLQQLTSGRTMSLWGWAYLYFHRLYRILPAYMFVLFLMWAFLKYMGNGPLWASADQFNDQCPDYWWTNLLFLNNFIPNGHGSTCIGHTWYLANDMQFFWISPPLFFLYYRVHKACGWLLLAALTGTTILSTSLISNHYDYNAVVLAPEDATYNDNVYIKPYCRVVSYAFGIAAGLVIFSQRRFKAKGEIYDKFALWISRQIDKSWVRHCSVVLGLGLINFIMFIQLNTSDDASKGWTKWTKAENILYLGFFRTVFALGLTMVLLPMLQGYYWLGIWFLAHPVWTPFARLTFCTYLIHISLIVSYYFSASSAYWLNDLNIVTDIMFVTIISYAAAVPLTLAVESPFMALEKLLKTRKAHQSGGKK